MHPWVKSDKPGQCTVCGMDLVPIFEGGQTMDHALKDMVILPKESVKVVGVRTSEVTKHPLLRTLHVAGTITEDETKHGVICASVEGRIDGLVMSHDGQLITRRQPLYTLYSRTLLAAVADYRNAQAQGGNTMETAKRRLEQLGLVSEQILTLSQRQPDEIYFGIPATLTGNILKTFVTAGQYVREGDKLFEIADFTTMWFHFIAYEQDLPFIKERQVIRVTTPSLPGKVINARVGYISPTLDEATHSTRVRVVLENPDRALKYNAYAEGVISVEEPALLAVPRTAVLWPGQSPHVYIEKDPGAYEQRQVKLGRAGESDWEVLEGLKEGERVVTHGALLMDAQAQLNQFLSPP